MCSTSVHHTKDSFVCPQATRAQQPWARWNLVMPGNVSADNVKCGKLNWPALEAANIRPEWLLCYMSLLRFGRKNFCFHASLRKRCRPVVLFFKPNQGRCIQRYKMNTEWYNQAEGEVVWSFAHKRVWLSSSVRAFSCIFISSLLLWSQNKIHSSAATL